MERVKLRLAVQPPSRLRTPGQVRRIVRFLDERFSKSIHLQKAKAAAYSGVRKDVELLLLLPLRAAATGRSVGIFRLLRHCYYCL